VARREAKLAVARQQRDDAQAQHAQLVASGGEQRLAAAAAALVRAAARLRAREAGRSEGAAWAEAEVRRLSRQQTHTSAHGPAYALSRAAGYEAKAADSDEESKAAREDFPAEGEVLREWSVGSAASPVLSPAPSPLRADGRDVGTAAWGGDMGGGGRVSPLASPRRRS
jgi:hypothetical protein